MRKSCLHKVFLFYRLPFFTRRALYSISLLVKACKNLMLASFPYCWLPQLVLVTSAIGCFMSTTGPLMFLYIVFVANQRALNFAFGATITWSTITMNDMGTSLRDGPSILRAAFRGSHRCLFCGAEAARIPVCFGVSFFYYYSMTCKY